jgi:hypothetical protein
VANLSPMHDPNDAWNAIYDYRVNGSPPPAIAAHLDTFLKGDSISFAASNTAELAFALKATAPKPFLLLAANVATYALQFGVDNMGGARGVGIYQALARDAGVTAMAGMAGPDPKNDPACRDEFDPAKPAPEPAPAPQAAHTPIPAPATAAN